MNSTILRYIRIAVLMGITTAFSASAAYAGKNITLCGGSPGGLWSLLGTGLDSAIRAIDPKSTVTYQTSSGGFANIVQLGAKKCDLAIVHVGEVIIASRGEPPFKKPTKGVSAISLLYDWAPMQWVIDKSYAEKNSLKSISDITGKSTALDLVVNRRGILPSILAEQSLELSGTSFKAIEASGGNVQFQGSKNASELMQDSKADMWVNATFIGSGSIKAIAKSRELTLLSVSDDVIAKMGERYGSKAVTIPAGAYPWLDHEVKTFGAQAALIAADDVDPEIVKLVINAIIKHPEKIQGVHKAMKAFNGKLAASIKQFLYHPQAAELLKGAGLQ